mmetsp:Transcript_58741/g.115298  ORF Transcript_58741/g.115298 Transcript_58741/m.115298 type:complete len:287 (-) Transcript_58741:927-1787(-)
MLFSWEVSETLLGSEVCEVVNRVKHAKHFAFVDEGDLHDCLPRVALPVGVNFKISRVEIFQGARFVDHELAVGLGQEAPARRREHRQQLHEGRERAAGLEARLDWGKVHEVGSEGSVQVGIKPAPRPTAVVVVLEHPVEPSYVVLDELPALARRLWVFRVPPKLVLVVQTGVRFGVKLLARPLVAGPPLKVRRLVLGEFAQEELEPRQVHSRLVRQAAAEGREHVLVRVHHHTEGPIGDVEVDNVGQEVVADKHAHEHEVIDDTLQADGRFPLDKLFGVLQLNELK